MKSTKCQKSFEEKPISGQTTPARNRPKTPTDKRSANTTPLVKTPTTRNSLGKISEPAIMKQPVQKQANFLNAIKGDSPERHPTTKTVKIEDPTAKEK
jgi:hypothetical protein